MLSECFLLTKVYYRFSVFYYLVELKEHTRLKLIFSFLIKGLRRCLCHRSKWLIHVLFPLREKCPNTEYLFWSIFAGTRADYEDLLRKSPYSARVRTSDNSLFGHFSTVFFYECLFLIKIVYHRFTSAY